MIKVATFNVHDNVEALARSFKHADLVLWQETPVPAATRWMMRRLDALDADVHRTGVATGWHRSTWAPLGRSRWHKAHNGRRKVTPRRGTLVTHLKHQRHGFEIAVLNGHRINRTRGHWLAIPRIRARWRADRWNQHHELDARLVADLISSGCRLILYGGDYNRRNVPKLHPQAVRLTGAHIDQLWLIDLDHVLAPEPLKPIRRLGSDHPLRRVHFALSFKRKA